MRLPCKNGLFLTQTRRIYILPRPNSHREERSAGLP